jgi:hypothetical protein
MIRLGEFVGAVLNEMAVARTKATLFGAQMAADFRDHELLRHLPIPIYRIGAADVSLPFAVASVSAGRDEIEEPSLDPSALTAAAKEVTAVLPEQEELKEAFSLYDDQVEHWHSEIVPVIAERFATDAAGALSFDGMGTLYGHLVKSHYVLSLVRERGRMQVGRIRESIKAGRPDLVELTASRLLKRELERRSAGRAEEDRGTRAQGEEEQRERRVPSTPMAIDSTVYVEVEAKELKHAEHVSTLKLELEEGILERMTFSDAEEVGDEERHAARADAQANPGREAGNQAPGTQISG